MRKLFLVIIFCLTIGEAFGVEVYESHASANTLLCRDVFDLPTTHITKVDPLVAKNIEKFEQVYTRSRGLESYQSALGNEFVEALNELAQKGGHWLDSGAGEALAIQQFLKQNPLESVVGSIISLETEVKPNERLEVLKGRFIEEIPLSEIPRADLITDVFGPLAYSGHPHIILKKYFNRLKDQGQIFIFLGTREEIYGRTNRVITKEARFLSIADWVKKIQGVSADLYIDRREDEGKIIEKWALRLRRNSNERLFIPDLDLKNFLPGAPPKMLFQEKGFSGSKGLREETRELSKSKIQEFINGRLQVLTFTQFMNSFRSGEISHPLVSTIKKLALNEKWINISNLSWDVKQEISEKAFDESDNNIYLNLSQKWMRYRINSINPDKFYYTALPSSKTIESIENIGLLTDFYGDFVSSTQPDMVLQRYLNSVNEKGTIYIYLGPDDIGFGTASEVLTKAGKKISIRDWLKSIKGLDVRLYRGGFLNSGGEWAFVKITKQEKTIVVPPLRFLATEENIENLSEDLVKFPLPLMIFQEK